MAKKKYRIVLGMCGPTPIETNIIKAEDKKDAIRQYLISAGEEPNDIVIHKYMEHTFEVSSTPKRKEDEPIVDAFGKAFAIGKNVAFIHKAANQPPVFRIGQVVKITNSSVVLSSNGRDYRVTCSKGTFRIDRAVIMKKRKEREGDKLDGTGYPVHAGDKVAFTGDRWSGINTFYSGIVKDIKNVRLTVDYRGEQLQKNLSKVIVL